MIEYLELDDLLEIAGGVLPDVRIRDLGLLESAAQRPRTLVFGAEVYARFEEKAAALMHSLARNHPLVDGNKRLAWSATRVFCLMNGRDLVIPVDDAETIVIAVATGKQDVPDLANELARWIREA